MVTLHIFSGMEETVTYSTTLSVDDTFRFSGVPFNEGQTLVARAVHDGVTYVSEFATLELDQQEVQLPLTIYDTTENPANVAIGQLHVFLNRTGGQLEVAQYCLVNNTGDRTYVGRLSPAVGERTTWSIVLPDDAENLRFDGAELGGRFLASDDGFGDTRPVLPGAATVEASFTYELQYRDDLPLEQAFDVPVNAAVVVLPGGDLALRGTQLSAEETLETQMGPALSYMVGPLSRGEPLAFAVVPRAPASSAAQPIERSDGLAVGIAALAAAGVFVYWMWRSPAPGPVPTQVRSQVEAIATLDREYEAGLVTTKPYRQERAALKRQVSEQLPGKRV
jgi:hypothetical protein